MSAVRIHAKHAQQLRPKINSVTTAMIFPVLDLLVKHGQPDILGGLYIMVFYVLAIFPGATNLSEKTATILTNLKMSPLILAASGILHSSNSLRKVGDAKLEWAVMLAFHILIAGATTILAVGTPDLQSSSPLPSELKMGKAGIALLTIGWKFLIGWTVKSWFRRGNTLHAEASRAGRKILIGVAPTLVFIGTRVLHTLVAVVSQNKSLNPVTGTLAVRVVLVFLPEQSAALTLLACVWIARNGKKSESTDEEAACVRLDEQGVKRAGYAG